MKNTRLLTALLSGTMLLAASPAVAQQTQDNTAEALIESTNDEPMSADQAAAKAQFLEAQVESLQQQIDELKKAVTTVTPSWKGAPQFEDKDNGWSFKPRGRLQYDVGYVENPGGDIQTRNLGFNTRARRIRLGVEGTIPGGFGYKAEMDFANSAVSFGDVILTYAPKGKFWNFTIGNHETFESLEQMTSSRFISFLERAQMNDAFIHTRRIGASFGVTDKANIARLNAGLFANRSIDNTFDNDGWIFGARGTYSPQALGGMLHLGANFNYRNYQNNLQQVRYRARPFLQTTDQRFVDTGTFAAKSDMTYGVELGGIFGSFHAVAEAQMLSTNAFKAGDTLEGLDATGTTTVLSDDPNFFSWYAEAGYYLTGETRGYKNGMWDRTKVLKPFSKGGWGALQLNARYDFLDLATSDLRNGFNNNFGTGRFTPSNVLTRGGTQTGYLASLIWIPEDYVRFLLQFSRAAVKGGPFAGIVDAGSADPLNKRDYNSNGVALRAQVDF